MATEKFLQNKTDEYFKKVVESPGQWIHFDRDSCGINRAEIYNRVKSLLRLMGIRFARNEEFPQGEIDYGHGYKIKVLTEPLGTKSSRGPQASAGEPRKHS